MLEALITEKLGNTKSWLPCLYCMAIIYKQKGGKVLFLHTKTIVTSCCIESFIPSLQEMGANLPLHYASSVVIDFSSITSVRNRNDRVVNQTQ